MLPASKSISNRALILNALSKSTSLPDNLSDSDDTRVMLRALQDMPEFIDIGAAGTAMRFLTAYLSVMPGEHTISGTERMKHRPIGILVDALRQLGATITYEGEEGFPPLRIVGHDDLDGGSLTVPGDVSSQYISALLMIAPTLKEGLHLTLEGNIASRPYLDMTISMMRDFGAKVEWQGDNVIEVQPGSYLQRPYHIESDWSAASYWYEMVPLLQTQMPRWNSLACIVIACKVIAECGNCSRNWECRRDTMWMPTGKRLYNSRKEAASHATSVVTSHISLTLHRRLQ